MKSKASHSLYAESLAPLHCYGPQLSGDHCRFTIWCRDADALDLFLFANPSDLRPLKSVHLNPEDHRFGDVWSVDVSGVKPGWCYVWKVHRKGDERFSPDQYVLDPYAPAIAGAPGWGQSLIRYPGDPFHTGKAFPKALIVESDFDWEGDTKPDIPWHQMVIYEVHVRGFTAGPGSQVNFPGTYRGFIEKIPYLKSLGITTVELLPVYEFDEMEYYHSNDPRSQLRNFWGYSTQGFFAPMSRYAASGTLGQQVDEFKSLVKAIHEAGMEVILDVVYNHTSEGGDGGPVMHFKVLGEEVYYLHDPEHGHQNYSGCGNTVNCNHPVVQDFIIDSLRHWVTEYHVDGFRFDLAPILCRGRDGELMESPPLIERIDEDPVLRGVKMIAEAWDAAGAYQVGSFPSPRWPEWNGRYRDDVRRFWSGEPGRLSTFATAVLGSEDLYSGQPMGALKSVNFITCHDGFTLRDIVTYRQKHNEANLEENRDGENHNHSSNWGVEGETEDHTINALRLQMQKNFLATLLISRGIPMIPAGDERGRTQRGNNNAYCQDNELSWLDWTLDEDRKSLLGFFKKMRLIRHSLPALHFPGLIHDQGPEIAEGRLTWIGPDNREPDWENDQAVGLRFSGKAEHLRRAEDAEDVLIFFNASAHPVKFHLPDTDSFKWKMRAYTTSRRVHRGHLGTTFVAKPHSLVLFSAKA